MQLNNNCDKVIIEKIKCKTELKKINYYRHKF